ncbi:hypothetical protein SFRURICE_018178 [Spodoptera frugiperda]|nr:hypothetical protein SFRURICE_018178 [Spodoptera frugiperda]
MCNEIWLFEACLECDLPYARVVRRPALMVVGARRAIPNARSVSCGGWGMLRRRRRQRPTRPSAAPRGELEPDARGHGRQDTLSTAVSLASFSLVCLIYTRHTKLPYASPYTPVGPRNDDDQAFPPAESEKEHTEKFVSVKHRFSVRLWLRTPCRLSSHSLKRGLTVAIKAIPCLGPYIELNFSKVELLKKM